MCVGIPAKVIKIYENERMADVAIGGIVRKAGLHLLENVKEDQYVILHAGFAIQVLDEKAAKETIELLGRLDEVR
jgi:hydrogenase expression/formation protein HypC